MTEKNCENNKCKWNDEGLCMIRRTAQCSEVIVPK